MAWEILGRTREARLEVEEAPAVVCSVRMVVLWAMQALGQVSMGSEMGMGRGGGWTY